MRRALIVGLAAGMLLAIAAPSRAVIPGAGLIHKKNMEWVWNNPQAAGSDLEFFEQLNEDGSVSRYAITGSMGNGFNIYDIDDPTLPLLVGTFVDPGFNWQGDIQINPRREIAVIATQGAIGFTLSHGASDGLAFVDISDVTNPTLLGVINGLGGAAHNSTMIDDEIIYTTGAARMVDYSDPTNPKDLGQVRDAEAGVNMCSGHDITVDPNRPHVVYNACGSRVTEIWDVSDSRNPKLISKITDNQISISHQADPSVDGSFLWISDEQGGGLSNVNSPGGGLHMYDISGKYVEGASLENPKKFGFYVIPWEGAREFHPSAPDAWGNVTSHVGTFQSERNLLSIGWYTIGSWVADLSGPTNGTGPYDEYAGTRFGGPTTWGNTQGGVIYEGDETWSSKWTRFDDPLYDRYIFTNGLTRGMDVIRYTGAMPQKMARLTADADGSVVSGVLDRYAVWTYEGYVNKPLAGKTVSLKVDGGDTFTATTGDDGSFSVDLGLDAGTYDVTVSWTDATGVYQTATADVSTTV